jgi:hypothetical protein
VAGSLLTVGTHLIRVLLVSLLPRSFDAGASERGVEERLPLLGRLARLVSGASDVKAVGGVSSRFIDNDFTGVLLVKWSRLARTSVC